MNLKLFVILLSVFAISVGYLDVLPDDDDDMYRNRAIIEDHPYQISIYYKGLFGGGGAILNTITIISAAQCVNGYSPEYFAIQVGSETKTKGEEYDVSQIFVHITYNNLFTEHKNDIAIIRLVRPLQFTYRVRPIELQPAGFPVPAGTWANITGWGQLPSTNSDNREVLHVTRVEVIERYECETIYRGRQEITDTMFCARNLGNNACIGDYGSPLVANRRLIGIMTVRCSYENWDYPSIYTSVSALHNFIVNVEFGQ